MAGPEENGGLPTGKRDVAEKNEARRIRALI